MLRVNWLEQLLAKRVSAFKLKKSAEEHSNNLRISKFNNDSSLVVSLIYDIFISKELPVKDKNLFKIISERLNSLFSSDYGYITLKEAVNTLQVGLYDNNSSYRELAMQLLTNCFACSDACDLLLNAFLNRKIDRYNRFSDKKTIIRLAKSLSLLLDRPKVARAFIFAMQDKSSRIKDREIRLEINKILLNSLNVLSPYSYSYWLIANYFHSTKEKTPENRVVIDCAVNTLPSQEEVNRKLLRIKSMFYGSLVAKELLDEIEQLKPLSLIERRHEFYKNIMNLSNVYLDSKDIICLQSKFFPLGEFMGFIIREVLNKEKDIGFYDKDIRCRINKVLYKFIYVEALTDKNKVKETITALSLIRSAGIEEDFKDKITHIFQYYYKGDKTGRLNSDQRTVLSLAEDIYNTISLAEIKSNMYSRIIHFEKFLIDVDFAVKSGDSKDVLSSLRALFNEAENNLDLKIFDKWALQQIGVALKILSDKDFLSLIYFIKDHSLAAQEIFLSALESIGYKGELLDDFIGFIREKRE